MSFDVNVHDNATLINKKREVASAGTNFPSQPKRYNLYVSMAYGFDNGTPIPGVLAKVCYGPNQDGIKPGTPVSTYHPFNSMHVGTVSNYQYMTPKSFNDMLVANDQKPIMLSNLDSKINKNSEVQLVTLGNSKDSNDDPKTLRRAPRFTADVFVDDAGHRWINQSTVKTNEWSEQRNDMKDKSLAKYINAGRSDQNVDLKHRSKVNDGPQF